MLISMKQAMLLILVLFAVEAHGEDSVVIGRGISNEYLSNLPCPDDSICMNSMYIWTFAAKHTIAGPEVKGKVRFLAVAHGQATPRYVKSVQLFVLRPIENAELLKSSGAQYYLLSLSPRYANGTYCISVKPEDVGLHLKETDVSVDSSGGYCFQKSLL